VQAVIFIAERREFGFDRPAERSNGGDSWQGVHNMAPDPEPILSAAHVATLTWDNVTECERLRRSHEALRDQVRVLTEMHRHAVSDADELRDEIHRQAIAAADELTQRLRDLEDDARARFTIERAELERRVRELEVAISKVLAWSEFAFPRGEPAAIHDARATLAPSGERSAPAGQGGRGG
jgi:hypothetical protein